MSNMGHNSESYDIPNIHTGIAGLKTANEAMRAHTRGVQDSLIIIARWLVYIDAATGNAELTEAAIKANVSMMPSDLIASPSERVAAKWLARGGLKGSDFSRPKNTNEINDLSAGSLNDLEAKVGTKRYAKASTWGTVYNLVGRECKNEIRKAFNGGEGVASIDEVRAAYSGVLFLAETVDAWIAEEEYRRSSEYARILELKKAWAMRISEELEIARRDNKPELIEGLAAHVKKQLKVIREAAAQMRAEKEAKEAAKTSHANLTAEQRRRIQDDMRREQDGTSVSQGATDEDFQ
jgi:hypothetical protein